MGRSCTSSIRTHGDRSRMLARGCCAARRLEPIRTARCRRGAAFRTTDRGKFRIAIGAFRTSSGSCARCARHRGPRDLVGLKLSLAVIPRVRAVSPSSGTVGDVAPAELDELADVATRSTRRSSRLLPH